jgi:hypothetical protein
MLRDDENISSQFSGLSIQQLRRSHKKGSRAEIKRRLKQQEIDGNENPSTFLSTNHILYKYLIDPKHSYTFEFFKYKNVIIIDNKCNNLIKLNVQILPIKLSLEEEANFMKSTLLFFYKNGIIQDNLSMFPF